MKRKNSRLTEFMICCSQKIKCYKYEITSVGSGIQKENWIGFFLQFLTNFLAYFSNVPLENYITMRKIRQKMMKIFDLQIFNSFLLPKLPSLGTN